MGKDNIIDFNASIRLKIVKDDFKHDKNVVAVTGAIRPELKEEWNKLYDLELKNYEESGALDCRFINMKPYLLSLLFNLTSGVTVAEAWEMFECLDLPEEIQKTAVALAIKFSPRGNDLRLHIIRENARKNIRIAR